MTTIPSISDLAIIVGSLVTSIPIVFGAFAVFLRETENDMKKLKNKVNIYLKDAILDLEGKFATLSSKIDQFKNEHSPTGANGEGIDPLDPTETTQWSEIHDDMEEFEDILRDIDRVAKSGSVLIKSLRKMRNWIIVVILVSIFATVAVYIFDLTAPYSSFETAFLILLSYLYLLLVVFQIGNPLRRYRTISHLLKENKLTI